MRQRAVVAGILAREQWVVRGGRLERIDHAFFTLNNETVTWEEWHLEGVLVKRNAHVRLMKWPEGMDPAVKDLFKSGAPA